MSVNTPEELLLIFRKPTMAVHCYCRGAVGSHKIETLSLDFSQSKTKRGARFRQRRFLCICRQLRPLAQVVE